MTEPARAALPGGELPAGQLGARATLLQFSSAFCQPCRATRRVLAEVAALVPGVAHVEVDAESRLDVVRGMGVERTPTVILLDRDGREVRRATGVPRRSGVLAALAEAVDRGVDDPVDQGADAGRPPSMR